MNDKCALKDMQLKKLMHQREKISKEQVVGKLNANILLFINEVELSIYRFLVLRTKYAKK